MLYEVITEGEFLLGDADTDLTTVTKLTEEHLAGNNVADFLLHQPTERPGAEERVVTRITSYNVCYTKLLRMGSFVFPVGKLDHIKHVGGESKPVTKLLNDHSRTDNREV